MLTPFWLPADGRLEPPLQNRAYTISTGGRPMLKGPFSRTGGGHFAELWYMFDHLDQQPWPWTEAYRRLAEDMSAYWAAFASYGDPNGLRRPIWPPFGIDEQQVLILDETIRSGTLPNNPALDVFDTVYDAIR